MELIDTHCHIHEALERSTPVYDKWHEKGEVNIDTMIADAHDAGVMKMICVGTTLADSQLAVKIASERENVYSSIGIHPHEAKDHSPQSVKDKFASLVSSGKIVAVGECGLDYFYNHSPKEEQVAMLKFQIELALKHDLPLIFHVRNAFDDFWPIFDSFHQGSQKVRGVLHSFTDSISNLEKALERGLFVGVNGIATFSKDLELFKAIPLENMLLETDSPFLTPAPYRGTINSPKHTRVIAEYLADLEQVTLAKLAADTTANANRLFGI